MARIRPTTVLIKKYPPDAMDALVILDEIIIASFDIALVDSKSTIKTDDELAKCFT